MKKTLLCLTVTLLLCLCGCTTNSLNKMGSYSVAAIGFEGKDKDFSIYVEAVVVNSEDSDKPVEKMLFKGEGDTPEKAYEEAISKSAKPFSLGHCAVLVLSEDIEEQVIEDVFDFCLKERDITVSVSVVSSENVEKLLQAESFSSVAAGYDIVSILETQYKVRKIGFSNRLYEVATREKDYILKSLPEFSVLGDEITMRR